MTTPGVEIIDLTESLPRSPPTSVHAKSLRRQKYERSERRTSSASSPIVISDGEEPRTPPVASASGKKRRTRKKKKKVTTLEEGEVARDDEDTGSGNGEQFSGDAVSQTRDTLRHSSSPPLFYLDDKPDVPPNVSSEAVASTDVVNPDSLLLPEHVVFDAGHNAEAAVRKETSTMLESDTDDFIFYADAELNLFTRYYEEPRDENDRKAHLVCGQCGAEGDHKQADCPVLVCLTCGAHNEHSTRQCPIVKTCFSCGLKGHIYKDCPTKHVSRRMIDRDYDCNRCGSNLHRARECPTLWRMYEYVDDEEREATLRSRREKENLPIGQGGEGYIGEDYWCYNCGGEGHLGDDCEVEALQSDAREYSAFSSFNTMSGPFANREHTRSDARKLRREWELNGNFDDGHGFAGPSDVGKRGRDKERERMRRREKETQEVEVDEDDWFGGRLQSKPRRRPSPIRSESRKANEKPVFHFQHGRGLDKDRRRPGDRLLDRISSRTEGEPNRNRRTRDRDRRSASPRANRDSGSYRSDADARAKRGRARESERDRVKDRDRELSHKDTEGDTYRTNSRTENRKRDEDKTGRRYYGGYVR